MAGPEKKDRVISDKKKELVAYHEAGHALVGALMPDYDPVAKVSIIPRGQAGGLTFFTPSEERMESGLYSRSYLQNQMAVALGGRVAEEIVYGEEEVTTGASNDLQQVANVARQMITKFGMSDKIGPVALGQSQGGMFLGRDMSSTRDFSEDTAATIDVEVSELVDVAYKRATKVLSDNRTVLDEMAQMLIERETIDTEDIQDLLNRSEVKVANYIYSQKFKFLMNNKEDSFSELLKTESFFLLIKPEHHIYSNTSIRNSFFEELEYLVKLGLKNIEISWSNNENRFDIVSDIKIKYPRINLGSASIVNKQSIEDSLRIGLSFSMMKFWDKDLFNYSKSKNYLLIPGIKNLKDLEEAINLNCNII